MNKWAAPSQITVESVEISVFPLTMRDWHSLTLWMKSDFLKVAFDAMPDNDDARKMVFAYLSEIDWSNETARKALFGTQRGIAELVKVSTRQSQSVCDLIATDPTYRSRFLDAFSLANDLFAESDTKPVERYDVAMKKAEDVLTEKGYKINEIADLTLTQISEILRGPHFVKKERYG